MTTPQTHFTVEQASRWLTCAQPVALPLLQRLGKDCSMVCRIRGATFVDVPVQGKNWPTERGYPAAVIQEVFLANPDTRPHVPKPAAPTQAPAPSIENVTVRIGGQMFRCDCGCNVFHHPEGSTSVYECNACEKWYEGLDT